jgi:hypothetical protein
LESTEVRLLVPLLERYLAGERDLRGYDTRLGWIHAVAQAADAGANLVRCPEVGVPDVLGLLGSLRDAAARQHHVYAHGEDERLARAIRAALARPELEASERMEWLTGFRHRPA